MNQIMRNNPRDAWMAAALRSRAEHAHLRSDCPRPERIWDAVQLQSSLDDRLEIIDHLAECPTCAEAWKIAAELVPAHEELEQPRVSAFEPTSAYGRTAMLLAAPMLLLVSLGIAFIVYRPAGPPGAVSTESAPTAPASPAQTAQHTSSPVPAPAPQPTVTETPAIVPSSQARNVAETLKPREQQGAALPQGDFRLRWTPGPAGSRYDVTVMRRDMNVVAEVRDLVVTEYRVPPERLARVADGTELLWRVVAHTPQGFAVSSGLFAVRLRQEMPTPRALTADERAIQVLILTYDRLIATRDWGGLRAIQPGITSAELEALQREARVLDSINGLVGFKTVQVDGRTATARFLHRYTVSIDGQRQVRTTNQVMRLEKTENGSWIVLGTTLDTPLSSPVESDESAIRRVIATYETALETKDVDLYRSVRPGLSAAEEARFRDSFRQIDNQGTITIVDIRVGGKTAIAWISRRDVITTVGGLRQVSRVGQTLFLEKSASAWIITAIESLR